MNKSIVLAVVLCLCTSFVAAAKSYDVSIAEPSKAGATQLAEGVYTLTVKGDKAIFTDSHYKRTEVPVKIENGTAKYEVTSVEAVKKDGAHVLIDIQLKDSTTKLVFSN